MQKHKQDFGVLFGKVVSVNVSNVGCVTQETEAVDGKFANFT